MRLSWQYIAGFFDGEGSLGTYVNARRSAGQTVVTIAQSGERGIEVLSAIRDFMLPHGITALIDTRPHRGAVQTMYVIRVCGRKQVELFCRQVRPYVLVKKQIVEDTMRWLIAFPPVRGAFFRELNAERKRNGWYERRRTA